MRAKQMDTWLPSIDETVTTAGLNRKPHNVNIQWSMDYRNTHSAKETQ